MKNDFTENFALRRIVEISIVNTAITASNIALFLFELENINLRVHEIGSPEKQKMKVCDTWSARAFVNIDVRYLMVVNTPPSFKICIEWCDNSNVARSFVRQRGSRRITWESRGHFIQKRTTEHWNVVYRYLSHIKFRSFTLAALGSQNVTSCHITADIQEWC